MFDNISVPGAVAIAILVVLVLIVIVRNIYIVQQSKALCGGAPGRVPLRVGRGLPSEGPVH